MKQVVLAAILALFGLQALAIDRAPAFEDSKMQARYERMTHQLRCLQCRSESIADSNAQLATDLRRQLRELMAAGKSDQEIMTYMTDRYGDYVLFNPPVTPRTWLLWAAPALLLIGGAIVAFIVISRKSKLPDTDPADPGLGTS
jgi:cytochrome c-type biogenesis protein CcmH